MPSTLQFDGPVLEDLLARVRAEVGDAGTIVRAERVRRGGIGGFFAREWFEVEVSVAGEDPLLALADRVSDAEAVAISTPDFDTVLARAQLDVPPPPQPRFGTCSVALSAPLQVPKPEEAEVTDWRGAVIAVVGPIDAARDVAARLSAHHECEPADVVVATPNGDGAGAPPWLVVADPAAAVTRRRSWRRRPHPTIVAVDCRPAGGDTAWARAVLAALEPSQVWGAVEASRKVADVQAWIDGIGGVDTIALFDAAASKSPDEVRTLGIPVGMVDGTTPMPSRVVALAS